MNDETTQTAHRVAEQELRQFVERIERLDAEKKDIAEARKETLAEAKARGYDTPAINALVKLRAADPEKLSEFEAALETYKQALGVN